MKCWGSNINGQLGDGTATSSPTPIDVSGIMAATSIAVSGSHSRVVLMDFKVSCWGANGKGQLGEGTTDNHATPVALHITIVASNV